MIKKVYTAQEVCSILGVDRETFERFAVGRGRYVIDAHTQLALSFETVRHVPLEDLSRLVKMELARKLSEIVPDVWQFTASDRLEIEAHTITATVSFLYESPQPATSYETNAKLEAAARHLKAFQYVRDGLLHE